MDDSFRSMSGYFHDCCTGLARKQGSDRDSSPSERRLGDQRPKLVCIDLQAYTTTQAPEREDILNIGGFSDAVFGVVAAFLSGDAARFVAEVETVEL